MMRKIIVFNNYLAGGRHLAIFSLQPLARPVRHVYISEVAASADQVHLRAHAAGKK